MNKTTGLTPEIKEIFKETVKMQNEIISIGKALLAKSLVAGTWGNISAKIPKTDLIVVTPSGCNYLELKAKDIFVVDSEGEIKGEFQGKPCKPSSELPLHLAIYKARPDIKAIVHTHSVFACTCAAAGKPIPPITEDLVQLTGGSVEVAQYALPGTDGLALNAVAALKNKMAVLLANHGVIGCGRTPGEALLACELVEKTAQIYIFANLLGGARSLSQQDVDIMHDFYLKSYSRI